MKKIIDHPLFGILLGVLAVMAGLYNLRSVRHKNIPGEFYIGLGVVVIVLSLWQFSRNKGK